MNSLEYILVCKLIAEMSLASLYYFLFQNTTRKLNSIFIKNKKKKLNGGVKIC